MADGRLTDDELWRCVETTLAHVVLPALPADEEWARAAAVQLIGLVRYAQHRPDDATDARTEELADVLAGLLGNELVEWDGERTGSSVAAAAGRALAAAIGRDDDAAIEVRRVLRPTVVRQLDDELAVTSSMIPAFRGVIDDGDAGA